MYIFGTENDKRKKKGKCKKSVIILNGQNIEIKFHTNSKIVKSIYVTIIVNSKSSCRDPMHLNDTFKLLIQKNTCFVSNSLLLSLC